MVSTPFRMQHARFTSSLPDLTLSGHTPLYSCMTLKVFKACLNILRKCHLYYLSQLITPSGSHLISWAAYQTAYIARLADKCGRSLPHKWYLDIKTNTTLPDSHDHLYDHYICSLSTTSAIDLVPDATITCTFTISLLKSLILLTNCECIRQLTTEVVSSYSWADLCDIVISYYRRLNISPDFSSPSSIVNGNSIGTSPLCDLFCLPSPVILLPGSHYHYYTDGFLINLGSPEVLMGWSWVQIVHDAGYLNSVATYALDTIRNWPSSTKAEAAAIYATLCVSSDDSTISIYTDSQAAIDGLHLCVSSTYTNSHLYYKTTNFELWASIERSIHEKRLTILPVKVKGYDGNYWNELADSLANSAHHSESASLLPVADYTSSHNVCLVYNDVVCESNPRRLIKTYYQATFMKDLLALKRFQFTFCLSSGLRFLDDGRGRNESSGLRFLDDGRGRNESSGLRFLDDGCGRNESSSLRFLDDGRGRNEYSGLRFLDDGCGRNESSGLRFLDDGRGCNECSGLRFLDDSHGRNESSGL
ncbi:ribonuclease H-like domain-containing protein [Rhizophagus clarus]|uniref:Ribonuclease H-like domain-containing protein n=1 Tax=Rhizophagus clarus TaxID=94130 RepID=A0A8H3LHG8_9GLOM|nr:ribonuclease H-like domain-containing protein [Rhizophagus clarus]